MIVSTAIQKMIAFYKGNHHDINHFLKVWSMAKTIGELEGLDGHTQEVLELTAVVHDIACPLCRESTYRAGTPSSSPVSLLVASTAISVPGAA